MIENLLTTKNTINMPTNNRICTVKQRRELNKIYAKKLTAYVKEHFGQEYFVSYGSLSYDIMSILFEYNDEITNEPVIGSVAIYLSNNNFDWEWVLATRSFGEIKINDNNRKNSFKSKCLKYYNLISMILADDGGLEAIAKEYAQKYAEYLAQENPKLYEYFTSND